MEAKITREKLFEKNDALSAYITDALSIYSGLRKTELTGVEGFKYAVKKKVDNTQIDDKDFSTFFNQILVVDYLEKNKINIFSLSEEEKRSLQAEISEKIFNSIISDDRKQVVVKSDGVSKENIDYEFVLNTFNYDEIVALEKFYDLAKKANVPYFIAINSDFHVSFNDTITIGCSKENLDQTLAVLNEFVSKNSDLLLAPMRFVKPVENLVGFRKVSHENIDVYTEVYNSLIKAIDDTLAVYGQVPENDLDRYKKLDAFSLNDAKTMLIENLKHNLENSRLDLENYGSLKKSESIVQMDETVIKVPQPTIAFEETKDITPVEPVVEEPKVETPISTGDNNMVDTDSTDKALDDFLNSLMPDEETKKPEDNEITKESDSSIPNSQEESPESETSSLTSEELDAILDNAAEIEKNKNAFDEFAQSEKQKREFSEKAQKYQSIISEVNFLNTKLMYNGEQISLLDYLDKIDVLDKIPVDATVTTENGKKSGEEFIRECVIPYALNKPDNDLSSIMTAYGAKVVKEKTGILSRLFK